MTDDIAPIALLADVDRQRRRTRRLVESDWFTFAVLGAALTIGGLVPDGWGWLFAVVMLLAYVAIGLRWRHVARLFSWAPGSVSLQIVPFALGAAIGGGSWALSELLPMTAATAAISAWTALGLLAFWRYSHSKACLVLAGIALAVGAVELAFGINGALLYGVAFAAWAAVQWFRLGRRAR